MLPYLTGFLIFISLIVYYKKSITKSLVGNFFPFFARNRAIGKLLGVKYLKSTEWSTNRKETKFLRIFPVISFLTGSKKPNSNEKIMENIKNLKKRQRNRIREIDITTYFDKDLDLSFDEFERLLIKIWTLEIAESMGIQMPPNEGDFIEAIMIMRSILSFSSSSIAMIIEFIKNYNAFKKVKPYFQTLIQEEKSIMFAPFITTIDTMISNFVKKSKLTRMSDVFKNIPLVFVPLECNGEVVILDVIPNEADHPGNSIFGPKGVICPGNIITSMMIKTMMELINNLDYQIVGEPRIVHVGFNYRVENKKDIRIVCKAIKEKVKLDWVVDDTENQE